MTNIPKISPKVPDRVLVIGAGPVGLMTAQRLLAAGIKAVVLESEPEQTRDLRATTFHPPTLDMLAEDGLADELVAAGLICREWQIRMHPSGEKVVFDMSVIADETAHPYRLQAEQFRLTGMLARRVLETGGEIHYGVKASDVRQNGEGVIVQTDQGEEFSASFAVAADGGQSVMRKQLGIQMQGSTYAQMNLLATTRFPFDEALEDLSNVTYAWAPKGNFALLRLPDIWRCSLYPPQDMDAEQAMSPKVVAGLMRTITPEAEFAELVDLRPYRVHRRLADKFSSGRVFLAGDAAHLNPPSGGMGMNGGIHDAVSLARRLAQVMKGADPSLLDAYEAERRPIVAADIIDAADANRRRMTEADPAKRKQSIADLQAIVADRDQARAYLLKSSMITGLRKAENLEQP